MTVLMILTATVIITTVTVAIFTARDLARLKARLAVLTERREECRQRFAEAADHRQSIVSTRDMLRSILGARKVQQVELTQELETLQDEHSEGPRISLSKPLHREGFAE